MSGKLGLGSTGRNVETLDPAYRPSRYQIHAFNSMRRISYILQRNPKVRDDQKASEFCNHVCNLSSTWKRA
jgi:hypothetical protein